MSLDTQTAQQHLDLWLAADKAVSTGQSYGINTGTGNRQVTRVDAAEIRQQIAYWQTQINALKAESQGKRLSKGSSVRFV